MKASNDSPAMVVMKRTVDLLSQLEARWASEEEYEDWTEYEVAMKKATVELPWVRFEKGTKRPFGFAWTDLRSGIRYRTHLTRDSVTTKVRS